MPERATRAEQTQVVTELRQRYSLTHILRVVKLPKSMYYYQINHQKKDTDDPMVSEIKTVKQEHPDFVYRRVVLALRRHHVIVNHKRVLRIMRTEGLQSKGGFD